MRTVKFVFVKIRPLSAETITHWNFVRYNV